MQCFRKRGLKSIATPKSPVARPELSSQFFCHPRVPITLDDSVDPDESLSPVAPLCASHPPLLYRRSAPACAARTPPRRGIRSSTSPPGNASEASPHPVLDRHTGMFISYFCLSIDLMQSYVGSRIWEKLEVAAILLPSYYGIRNTDEWRKLVDLRFKDRNREEGWCYSHVCHISYCDKDLICQVHT
jgi:hypothetical protein